MLIVENRLNVTLKPDWYDIFPSFTEDELEVRLKDLPFHLATQLSLKNIKRSLKFDRGRQGIKEFVEAKFSIQGHLLGEILEHKGFSPDIVKAIGTVKREAFVPEQYKRYSYLDTSIPFTLFSCISSPSVVALMIEKLGASPGDRILDIGIGSGYHACCLFESLHGQCNLLGVEVDSELSILGRRAIEDLGYPSIMVNSGTELDLLKDDVVGFDRIYTASAFEILPPHIIHLLSDNGRFQGARAVTRDEFDREHSFSWLRKTYTTYETYISMQWYQNFACLTTWLKQGCELREIDVVYDVIFVPYRNISEISENKFGSVLVPEIESVIAYT